MLDQELAAQLKAVKAKRRASRDRRMKRSKIESYRGELRILEQQGASLQDLVVWLADHKKIHVHRTTIARRLAFWKNQERQVRGT